jgi:hypothetical protein
LNPSYIDRFAFLGTKIQFSIALMMYSSLRFVGHHTDFVFTDIYLFIWGDNFLLYVLWAAGSGGFHNRAIYCGSI